MMKKILKISLIFLLIFGAIFTFNQIRALNGGGDGEGDECVPCPRVIARKCKTTDCGGTLVETWCEKCCSDRCWTKEIKCNRFQKCDAEAGKCRCSGECYPQPRLKNLEKIPKPPWNVKGSSGWKLPINFAWEDLNKEIAPCKVEYYEFQIPGVNPAFTPPPPSPPPEWEPPSPPPPLRIPPDLPEPPAEGWCSVKTLEPYFGENARIAGLICRWESGGNPSALRVGKSSADVGLFQINVPLDRQDLIEHYLDPINNIKEAVRKSNNGTYWGLWSVAYEYTCYKDRKITMLGIYPGCVPWHQAPPEGLGTDNAYNCWRCK